MKAKIEDDELHKIISLGTKHQDGTPRPLLVSLPSVDKKRMIMRNALRLKNNHVRIHISHDIAKEERKANNEFLKVVSKRNNDQSSKYFVSRVRGQPWEQKILELPVQVAAQGNHTAQERIENMMHI